MTESIPTTLTDERDDASFGIVEALRADADLTAQIETMQDVIAAEFWELMAVRAAERAKRHERDLVAVPGAVPARAAVRCLSRLAALARVAEG